MAKIKTYEVEIHVGDMEFPHIATLEVDAESAKKAREWVLEHLSVAASEADAI